MVPLSRSLPPDFLMPVPLRQSVHKLMPMHHIAVGLAQLGKCRNCSLCIRQKLSSISYESSTTIRSITSITLQHNEKCGPQSLPSQDLLQALIEDDLDRRIGFWEHSLISLPK